MRYGQAEQIRCPLIDERPHKSADEGHQHQPWIRKMEKRENKRGQHYAAHALLRNNLRPTIDKTLQHVLLHKAPCETERELASDRAFRVPAEKVGPRPED